MNVSYYWLVFKIIYCLLDDAEDADTHVSVYFCEYKMVHVLTSLQILYQEALI